jgi:hypothetical protein
LVQTGSTLFQAECFGGSQLGGDGQIVMTFRQLSQIWWELALHNFLVDCFGGILFGGDGQTIFTDSRLSEIWWELTIHYFPADCFGINFFRLSEIWWELALLFLAECFGGSQFGGDSQIVMMFRQLSQIWRELALHYFPVDCFEGI